MDIEPKFKIIGTVILFGVSAVFDDERVDVTTDGEYIAKDTRVRVVRADNMKVVVRAAPRLNA